MDHIIEQTDDWMIDALFALYLLCMQDGTILYLSLLSVSAIGINPLCSFKHFKGLNKKKKKANFAVHLTSEIT